MTNGIILRLLLALALPPALLPSMACASATAAPYPGERIYRDGLLADGQPLVGSRVAGGAVSGQAAACVNCHRRSGIGVSEGRIVIPPVTGNYLLHRGERPTTDAVAAATGQKMMGSAHYTDETVARAIRDGVGWDGRKLDVLMPRYTLANADMGQLLRYLHQLSSGPVPGVGADELDFATIVTPDTDPTERQGMLDVLNHFFNDRAQDYFGGRSPVLQSARRIHYRVSRRWRLHVWDLTGPPSTWEAQLDKRLAAEPVFAVISGLGGHTWEPVHRFCEHQSVPCLLPNVDLPVVAASDFYNVYFSKGVLLEAELLESRLTKPGSALKRVVQVYRAGDLGEAAAGALRRQLRAAHREVTDRVLPESPKAGDLQAALRGAAPDTALALWLRSADLKALPEAPPPAAEVFASGLLGGLENMPLAPSWRSVTRVTYPYNLPQSRTFQLNYPLRWFEAAHIPVVAERIQVDTYIACQVLSEAIGHVRGDFVRDYLLEQIESMLSIRIFNGYYNRLSLGPGQRFASKGGYFVRFAEAQGNHIAADGEWTVP
jgi:hypothetical protein